MKCLSCHKQISDTAKFCNSCGANQVELRAKAEEESNRKIAEKVKNRKDLIQKMKYVVAATAVILVSVGGIYTYNQNQDVDLSKTKAPILKNTTSTAIIDNFLKSNYDYIPAINCYRMSYVIKNNQFIYCVNLRDLYETTEDSKNYIYLTFTGVPVNENDEPIEGRGAAGLVELGKFENNNGALTPAAEREIFQSGSYGKAGIVKIIPIGKDNIGWVLIDGYAHMGQSTSFISLYSVVKKRIRNTLMVTTQFDNKDSCDPSNKTCSFITVNLDVNQIKTKSDYYPIRLTGSVTEGTLAQSKESSKKFELFFDAKSGIYKYPPELIELAQSILKY